MAWKLVNPNITNDPSYLEPQITDHETRITNNTTSLAQNASYFNGMVNLSNFGIKEKDDITTLLNQKLSDSTVKKVVVPSGFYIISDTITVPSDKVLELSGERFLDSNSSELELTTRGCTVLKFTKNSANMFLLKAKGIVTGGAITLQQLTYNGTSYPAVTNSNAFYLDFGNEVHDSTKINEVIVKDTKYNENTAVLMDMDSGNTGIGVYCRFNLDIRGIKNAYVLKNTNANSSVWCTSLIIDGQITDAVRAVWFNTLVNSAGSGSIINANIQSATLDSANVNYSNYMATPLIDVNAPNIMFKGHIWDIEDPDHQKPAIILRPKAVNCVFSNTVGTKLNSGYVQDLSSATKVSSFVNTFKPDIQPTSFKNYNSYDYPIVDNFYNVLVGSPNMYDVYVKTNNSSYFTNFVNIKDTNYNSRFKYYLDVVSGMSILKGINPSSLYPYFRISSVTSSITAEIKYVFKRLLGFTDLGVILNNRYFPNTVEVYATTYSGEFLLKSFDLSNDPILNQDDKIIRVTRKDFEKVLTDDIKEIRIKFIGIRQTGTITSNVLDVLGVWFYSNKKFANTSFTPNNTIFSDDLNAYTIRNSTISSILGNAVESIDFTTMTTQTQIDAKVTSYSSATNTLTLNNGLDVNITSAGYVSLYLKNVALNATKKYLLLTKYQNLVGKKVNLYWAYYDTADVSDSIEAPNEIPRNFGLNKLANQAGSASLRMFTTDSSTGLIVKVEKIAVYDITNINPLDLMWLEENFVKVF